MLRWVPILILAMCSSVSISTPCNAESRYRLVENTLIFNMTLKDPEHEFTGKLESYDSKKIAAFLFEYPEISTLKLTGSGGSIPAARQIADQIDDYGINTIAFGVCESACTRIFIAGHERKLEPGSRLGFHRQWLDASALKHYFEKRNEANRWNDEFDYFGWYYDILLDNLIKDLKFMQTKGISIAFVLNYLSYKGHEIWVPSIEELFIAGVLTH